jgi:hypothetical protein
MKLFQIVQLGMECNKALHKIFQGRKWCHSLSHFLNMYMIILQTVQSSSRFTNELYKKNRIPTSKTPASSTFQIAQNDSPVSELQITKHHRTHPTLQLKETVKQVLLTEQLHTSSHITIERNRRSYFAPLTH